MAKAFASKTWSYSPLLRDVSTRSAIAVKSWNTSLNIILAMRNGGETRCYRDVSFDVTVTRHYSVAPPTWCTDLIWKQEKKIVVAPLTSGIACWTKNMSLYYHL